jgi:hypothetical protein
MHREHILAANTFDLTQQFAVKYNVYSLGFGREDN